MGSRWGCPTVKPREIAFGALYDVASAHWTAWGATARGTGHLNLGRNAPNWNVHVSAYDVLTHNGRRYFDKLKLSAPGHKTYWLHLRSGLWVTTP
jgi:hypothetical protein